MTFSIQQIRDAARSRPQGYLEEVMAKGGVSGDTLEISEFDFRSLVLKYSAAAGVKVEETHPDLPEPSLGELASNFGQAMAGWMAAGAPVATADVYAQRAAICGACEFWDGAARLGLGKCQAPGCGCTVFKRWLATEKCPLGRWPA